LGKLGHPDGELTLTRAAAKHDIIQMVCTQLIHSLNTADGDAQIPTLASCSFDEIVDAAAPGQVQFLQLWVQFSARHTFDVHPVIAFAGM
jgi:L-lactate dehydrogenase (cytochrome)